MYQPDGNCSEDLCWTLLVSPPRVSAGFLVSSTSEWSQSRTLQSKAQHHSGGEALPAHTSHGQREAQTMLSLAWQSHPYAAS